MNRHLLQYQNKYFNSLKEAQAFRDTIEEDDTVDITISDYLKMSEYTKKHLTLFKTEGIFWEHQETKLDPYILGLWLGDGLSSGQGFTLNHEKDQVLLEAWEQWSKVHDAVIRNTDEYKFIVLSQKNIEANKQGKCNRIEPSPLKETLDKYNLINNKHIPKEYLRNDRKTRLQVLAGLIDTNGTVEGKEIKISQGPKNFRIVEEAYTLAMSLGFLCSLSGEVANQLSNAKTNKKKYSVYKELIIRGVGIWEIPTRLHSKKLVRMKDDILLTKNTSFMGSRFKLKKAGFGSFVGWQLEDPKGRFLLQDGTVVHNTPEGAPVGIVLNLSLLTRISERTPTVLVKEVVELCENIILIGDFDGPNEDTKVFLNGIILGMTDEPYELVNELKTLRNVKMLPWDVSISYDDVDEEIHICSDEGRLLRPVFTVKDGKINAEEKDGTNWDELVESGKITYIDNMEANGAVIAFHQNELDKYQNDYCEIAAAMMLGVIASIIPFPDHSQSPRNCYQAAMGKQAMSMFALSHLIRADTVVHVLTTPQRPLVSTRAADMMGFSDMPSGVNCVVAIACYTGLTLC